jgi:hypothetical protein
MRRLLWVGVGAGLGISGYRRATRVVRELTGSSSGPSLGRLALGRAGLNRPGRNRAGLDRARGAAGFVRDVREGMELYTEQRRLSIEPRRPAEGPTLGWEPVNEAGADQLRRRAPSRPADSQPAEYGKSAH